MSSMMLSKQKCSMKLRRSVYMSMCSSPRCHAYSVIQSIIETACQTSIAQSNSPRQADQRDTTNRSSIKDHQQICHQLAADTQMSGSNNDSSSHTGGSLHPLSRKRRKQKDSYPSSPARVWREALSE